MGALLRLLLVTAHLAAVASPCPPPATPSDAGARPSELHALCQCGCDGAPATTRSGQLGAALVPLATLPSVPRLAHVEHEPLSLTNAHPRTPEPVPRPA